MKCLAALTALSILGLLIISGFMNWMHLIKEK